MYQLFDGLIAAVFINSFHQRTPLHMAIEGNHKETVEYLVEKRAAINSKDKWGVSAIMMAVLIMSHMHLPE